MSDCLFCNILVGKIPCEKVYETSEVLAFKDISPQAPTHLLFIHKRHTENFNEMVTSDIEGLAEVSRAIAQYSLESGLAKFGYRVVSNIGQSAGQSVFHTHFHILSGAELKGFGS
jgi:histidine triad (HIT) family protein